MQNSDLHDIFTGK